MRHATQEALDRLEALLAGLRKLPGLRERKRGYFSKGSRAFLHFHADAGDLYVDVKLDSKFQRMKVTSRNEQADFLSSRVTRYYAPLIRLSWPAHSRSRSTNFWILPVEVFGSGPNSIASGHL